MLFIKQKKNSMKNKTYILVVLIFLTLITYLFVESPVPLPDGNQSNGSNAISVNQLFDIVAKENGAARALYTKEIVSAGKAVGLDFNENWRESDVEAGPLPALFLRETSKSLEKNVVPLSLFLGSDFPISASNNFKGVQLAKFNLIKQSSKPEYFFADDIKRYIAMYPDYAISLACVECHNKHPDSPKKDWQIQDLMGAVTWLYPNEYVTSDDLIQAVSALRQAFRTAYETYLNKVKTFKNAPIIGDKWPRDGYYLPTVDVFMKELEQRSSPETITALIQSSHKK